MSNPETERDLLRWAAASAHAHDDEDAEIIAVNVIEVPDQTSLAQDMEFEEERVQRQQELLDAARDIAADLEVGLRTRAIVGRNAAADILDVIEDEAADHVVLGWTGSRSTREHILGSNIDPIVERAPCETTLLKLSTAADASTAGSVRDLYSIEGDDEDVEVVVLAGEGPHAPVAARRAGEFVAASDGQLSLRLLNVQTDSDDSETDSRERGEAVIENLAERAGIEYMNYETTVLTADESAVRETILDAVSECDIVSVGATRTGAVSQALFGSIPEAIGEHVEGTVVMARGSEEAPRSIRDALVERLAT